MAQLQLTAWHRIVSVYVGLLVQLVALPLQAATGASVAAESRALVIVDPAVERSAFVVANLAPDAEVVVLDAGRDGLGQISAILHDVERLTSLHIISHGGPGALQLGSQVADQATLVRRASEIRGWSRSLAPGADVLLYGCNVAQGDAGFVRLLSDLAGADVAASADRTGSANLGGNWELEIATGPIESPSPFRAAIGMADDIVLALPANFSDELVVGNLSQPVDLVVLPGGEILVLQRQGTILIVDPSVSGAVASTYLQLPNIDSNGEKGLLSIALDPNFASNNYFYVYNHNAITDRARISRFIHDVDHAHASDEFVIWEDNLPTALQVVSDHWGGGFGFGPDGYLYLAVGDKSDVPEDAQDLTLVAGKVLRLNTAGADSGGGPWVQGAANAHLVPAGNPFIDGAGGVPDEIWALGLRNPFRAFWDLPSGRFFIGEVGGNIQSGADASHEDIHVVTTADGGANFGWPNCEGPADDCVPGPPTNFSPPLFSIQHPDSRSIAMGPVYRGSLFPSSYYGALFFTDYSKGWLRYITFDGSGNVASNVPTGGFSFAANGDLGAPVSLAVGADDALYYVDIVGRNATSGGELRRITYNSGNAPPIINQASADATASPTAPFTVNFTGSATDPEGQALTYTWDFGDGSQANGASPSHQYAAKGAYDAVLRVSDNLRTATADPIRIEIGAPPVPVIDIPGDGDLFRAGDVISLRGIATDPDGVLTNDSYRWTVRFLHDTHFHPALSGVPGTPCAPSGSTCTSFPIPATGHDYTDNTGYEITLDVTDSDGITASDVVSVFPDKVNLSFSANVPGGVNFFVDGIPRNSPFVLDTLIGFQHTVSVPNSVIAGGELYIFDAWSSGPTPSSLSQTITVPTSDQAFAVNYTNAGPVGTGPYEQQPDGTVSIQAEDFDANVPSGGSSWSTVMPAGATGLFSEAMQATNGGRLEYKINFDRTGTHYVYVRAFGPSFAANSVFIALDGNFTSNYVNISPLNSWQWEGAVAVNVNSIGEHTLGLTVRESGTQVDKIVVLTSATTPTGTGPVESPRAGGSGPPPNNPPVVSITAPASGSSFNVGDVINFAGTASDSEDGNISSSLSWSSSIGGSFGSTGSAPTSALVAGTHIITASVTDSGGAGGSDSITITVIDPGGGGGPGGTGALEQQPDGTVSVEAEDFDANVASGGTWSTISPAGATGGVAMEAAGGGRLEYRINFNRTGTHYVYVRAFGADYRSNSVYVGLDGNWTSQYANVSPLGSWQWEGAIPINVTSIGEHTLGLSVRESGTQVDKIVVLTTASTPSGSGPGLSGRGGGGGTPSNSPPTVMITAPADGSSFDLGQTIDFTGTASDDEDGDLTASINWNSNINGNFGMTGSVPISTLNAGTHTITASVADSGAAGASDSISVSVIDPGGGGGPGGTGPYLQQPDGSVSMEAENADANVASGGLWSTVAPAGASAGSAMEAGSGGRLEYRVNFNRSGTHYIFVRSFGSSFRANSEFVGIDGDWNSQYVNVAPLNSWQWEGPIAVNVSGTGDHTVGITVRESGTLVDKLVVLTSPSTPTGNGPAESPRAP